MGHLMAAPRPDRLGHGDARGQRDERRDLAQDDRHRQRAPGRRRPGATLPPAARDLVVGRDERAVRRAGLRRARGRDRSSSRSRAGAGAALPSVMPGGPRRPESRPSSSRAEPWLIASASVPEESSYSSSAPTGTSANVLPRTAGRPPTRDVVREARRRARRGTRCRTRRTRARGRRARRRRAGGPAGASASDRAGIDGLARLRQRRARSEVRGDRREHVAAVERRRHRLAQPGRRGEVDGLRPRPRRPPRPARAARCRGRQESAAGAERDPAALARRRRGRRRRCAPRAA